MFGLAKRLKGDLILDCCFKNAKHGSTPQKSFSPFHCSRAFTSENLRSRFDGDCRTVPHAKCWNCKCTLECERDKFFCYKCSLIQPPVKCVNYFQYLGLPVLYDIEIDLLTESFKKLQARLHPDRFSNKSQPEQENSALQASIINKAYKTLLGPLSRALYLLELYDFAFKEEEINVTDVEFLAIIMQLNESIMDAHDAHEVEKIAQNIRRTLMELQKEFSTQFKLATENRDFKESFRIASKMKYYVTALKNVDKKLGLD